MIKYLTTHVVMFHVLLLLGAFSWIHGGTRSDYLMGVVPWLVAFLLEGLLFFPQPYPSESMADARERVRHTLVRDPVFYISIALFVYFLIPMFNVALCPVCDYFAIAQGASPDAPIVWLPSCVNVKEHYSILLWFVPVFCAVLAVRHGMRREAKRMLMELMCWSGALVAVLGFLQQATGATGIFWGEALQSYFFATFGYPNVAGAFFTLTFALSVGVWMARAEEIRALIPKSREYDHIQKPTLPLVQEHYMVLAVVLNFFAALSTLCRAAILLTGLLVLFFCVYYFVGLYQRGSKLAKVKTVGYAVFFPILLFVAVSIFAPKSMMDEVVTITPKAVFDRVSGAAGYHVRVATEMYKANPVYGVGCWGYRHLCTEFMTPEEKKKLQMVGGANVHNDSLQFLAEHGTIGFVLLLAFFVCVMSPVIVSWYKLAKVARFMLKNGKPQPRPYGMYCVPPPVVATAVGTFATVLHSFGDLPFRCPPVLCLWVLAWACSMGYMPFAPHDHAKNNHM